MLQKVVFTALFTSKLKKVSYNSFSAEKLYFLNSSFRATWGKALGKGLWGESNNNDCPPNVRTSVVVDCFQTRENLSGQKLGRPE